jgi:hypothetical protein
MNLMLFLDLMVPSFYLGKCFNFLMLRILKLNVSVTMCLHGLIFHVRFFALLFLICGIELHIG